MNDEMTWDLYLSLSARSSSSSPLGACRVLASRILGPLKMTGKQLGWVYATLPLACVLAPMAAGQIVDRWCPTELSMAGAHLLGGVFLLAAARATRFMPLFLLMLGHCLCFAPTLAMVNSLTFAHMPNPEVNYFRVRMWGAVSWVLIGWMLSLWRRSGKLQVKGADARTGGGLLVRDGALLLHAAAHAARPHAAPCRSSRPSRSSTSRRS